MRIRSSLLIASLFALTLSACSSLQIEDPVNLGDGTYLITSHGSSVTEIKAELLARATEFCDDHNLTMYIESAQAYDGQTKIDTGSDADIGDIPGSVELQFSCRLTK